MPIGDWGAGWGPLCIDLTVNESKVNSDTSSWQLSWFDHECFDWQEEDYLDSNGIARGDSALPDFKSLLDIYFYGKYDKEYEKQLQEDKKPLPDYLHYIKNN